MASSSQEAPPKLVLNLLDLPRELRDLIWSNYCDGGPRLHGALRGYNEVPSPAALRVCKQMQAEISPIFYKSLSKVLLRDSVCIKLGASDDKDDDTHHPRYAGWNIWSHEHGGLMNIWVRQEVVNESDEVGWWVNVLSLRPQTAQRSLSVKDERWSTVLHFATTLDKMLKISAVDSVMARIRLRRIRSRVEVAIRQARKKQSRNGEFDHFPTLLPNRYQTSFLARTPPLGWQ